MSYFIAKSNERMTYIKKGMKKTFFLIFHNSSVIYQHFFNALFNQKRTYLLRTKIVEFPLRKEREIFF